jgi:hypothetical protein
MRILLPYISSTKQCKSKDMVCFNCTPNHRPDTSLTNSEFGLACVQYIYSLFQPADSGRKTYKYFQQANPTAHIADKSNCGLGKDIVYIFHLTINQTIASNLLCLHFWRWAVGGQTISLDKNTVGQANREDDP